MTQINKATFNTVASFNRRLQEHSEEVRPQTQATRPKTISEVQESLRPNTAGSILGRLGRPQIGRQLTQYTPPPPQIEQQPQPQPQQRRLTQTPPTYMPSMPNLDDNISPVFQFGGEYAGNGLRMKQILNEINAKLANNKPVIETRRERQELANLMRDRANYMASVSTDISTSENDLRNFLTNIGNDLSTYIIYYDLRFTLLIPYFTTKPANFVSAIWGTSWRIDQIYPPELRLRRQTRPPQQQEEKKQEETKQPDQGGAIVPSTPEQGETQTVDVSPGGDVIVPPTPPTPPNPSLRPTEEERLTDEQFASKYLEGVDYQRGITYQFTQSKAVNGQFEGVALGETFIYPISYVRPSTFGDSVNQIISFMKNLNDIISLSIPSGSFVWYGPDTPNNAFASGYADLIAFYHDCMYANQGASGINQNVEADRKSIKMAKIMLYFLKCRKAGRIPFYNVNVVIDGINKNVESISLDSEIGWIEAFIFAFNVLGVVQTTIGRGQELQPIQFTENQFLDYRFLIRHQKLKILYSYAVAINNNDVDFREAVPDPTFSGFLQKAETYYYYKNIQSANWQTIYNAFNNAVIKLDNELSRMTGTTQPDQVRRQYYTIIRNFLTVARVCVKTYYIDKRQKPANDWELRLSQDMTEGEQPDASELENIDEPISDIIAPVIYNEIAGDNRLMFLLRNMRVEGVVCY